MQRAWDMVAEAARRVETLGIEEVVEELANSALLAGSW